ncbi:MAG: hypothetical protein Q8K96_11085 [Rubrivivax sp.]|nr:hypothetical protein [Rubrivivax sp.]
MLWPRLGRFDADFALRDDRLVRQRLAQAFGDVRIEARRLIDGFVADPLPVSAAADAHTVLALGFESPMPSRVGLFETAAMPYLVDAGRRAAEAALPAIHALLHRAPQLAAA